MSNLQTPLMTDEQFESERERSDDYWEDYEVFDEGRDRFDMKSLVLRVVVGNFEHEQGHGKQFLPDSVDGHVWDHYKDWVPSQLSTEDKKKFARKVDAEANKQSAELYDLVLPEVTTDDGEVREDVDVDKIAQEKYNEISGRAEF